MIKFFLLLASSCLLFIASNSLHDHPKINIEQNAPLVAKPGSEFTVELTVNKGKLAGFAKLQQYLPEGFIAMPLDVQNADFHFDQQTICFTWQQLPVKDILKISYKIKVDSTCNGLKTLNGTFIYTENNEIIKTDIIPTVISVTNEAFASNENKIQYAQIERKIFSSYPDIGEYSVQLIIKKGLKQGFARFYDLLPEGYTANSMNTRGSVFAFENHMVKFTWDDLPTDSVFTISYNVKSISQKSGTPVITGMLVYGNEKTSNSIVSVSQSGNEKQVGKKEVEDKILSAMAEPPSNSDYTDKTSSLKTTPVYINIPAPQAGIYYKVQIAATQKSTTKDNAWFEKKHHITIPVDLTMEEGWKKYMIGTFNTYADAKTLQKSTAEKISDAFIVAYSSGQRILLKDAIKNNKLNQ